jgi:hypothetical protein
LAELLAGRWGTEKHKSRGIWIGFTVEKALSSLLWGLAKSIIAKAEEYKASGQLIPTRNLYIKTEVTDFKYEKRSRSYRNSFVSVEKEEWDWRDQFGFIEKVVKNIPEYSACVIEIAKRCQVPDEQANFWVTRFVQFVVSKIVTDDTDDEFLIDQIAVFLADLDGTPLDWTFVVWLDGLWLEDEKYDIEDKVILRRPIPSDLETETRFGFWPVQLPPTHEMYLWSVPDAILESSYRSSDMQKIQHEIQIILDTLCLFRLGSISATRTTIAARSILQAGTMYSTPSHLPTTYKYSLSATDTGSLQTFFRKMKPLLSFISTIETSAQRISPLKIAFERYKDALLGQGSIESKITSAITCFEALYLKSQERMELFHRLSQRVSVLLGLLGFGPLKVYNELSQAYEIRSTFIHGSQIDPDRQSSASQLCETIMDYARISLVVFIELQDTIDKEAFISKLDNSLLDAKALEKLRQLLNDNVLIARLNSRF